MYCMLIHGRIYDKRPNEFIITEGKEMAKKKYTAIVDLSDIKIRIPVPKPGKDHGDKTKYRRKPKYPKKLEE